MIKEKLIKLNNLPFFGKEALRTIAREDENTLSESIKRFLRGGELIKLKNGLYVTSDFLNKNVNESGFVEIIANRLCKPSYVSTEYVLAMNNILTEAVYTITSVTIKTSRSFSNQIGKFTYRTLTENLFFGYEDKVFNGQSYHIATNVKALFDYLYLNLNLYPKDVKGINLPEELRLNMNTFTKADYHLLKEYGNKSDNRKLKNVIENIITNASN